jgi:hypothetical protein
VADAFLPCTGYDLAAGKLNLILAQAFGGVGTRPASISSPDEANLDRLLARILGMLPKLQSLRCAIAAHLWNACEFE